MNIKLEGQNMPARDLEAFLPAIAIHLPKGASLQSGTLNANLNIQGPTNRLVTSGAAGQFEHSTLDLFKQAPEPKELSSLDRSRISRLEGPDQDLYDERIVSYFRKDLPREQ